MVTAKCLLKMNLLELKKNLSFFLPINVTLCWSTQEMSNPTPSEMKGKFPFICVEVKQISSQCFRDF